MSERPTGFAAHVAAEAELNKQIAPRKVSPDAWTNQEIITTRSNNPNVQHLNDVAQIEIWGTDGKTAGFVDPKTGNPLTEPVKGLLEEIRENPHFGNAPDRDRLAKDKETEILALQDEGLELCQAKLVVDLRAEDDQAMLGMVSKYVTDGGMSHDAALAKVQGIYKKKDAQRFNLIKSGGNNRDGIFTREEYNAALGGGSNTPSTPPTPGELTPAEAQRLQAVEAAVHTAATGVVAARNVYARLAAGRDRRAVTRGEFSQEKVAEAKANYDQAVRELAQAELELLHERGMEDAQLRQVVNISAVRFANMLSDELYAERLKATGRFEDGPGGLGSVNEINTRRNRLAGRFYDFWNRQKGVKGAVVKSASMIGIGAVAGIPAALAGTFLLGPIVGGALGAAVAAKIAKGYSAARISKSADAEVNAEVSSNELDAEATRLAAEATARGEQLDISAITDISQDQVAERVTRNRRNLAVAGAIGAIAGGASAYLMENVFGGNKVSAESSVGKGGAGLLGQEDAVAADLTPGSPDDGNGTGGALAGEGSGDSATSTSTAGGETVASKTLDLENGENIWGELSEYMNRQGIETTGPDGLVNIDAAKDAVLEANDLTEEEARHLPVGYKFKVPIEVLDRLK